MSESTIPTNHSTNSQSNEPSNYFIALTCFLLGHEIKAEISITKEQLRAIAEDERKCVPYHESIMEDIISDYLNENFETEGFIRERAQVA